MIKEQPLEPGLNDQMSYALTRRKQPGDFELAVEMSLEAIKKLEHAKEQGRSTAQTQA